MLLAVDIGNTNIVLALHNGTSWLVEHRIKSNDNQLEKKLEVFLENQAPDGCVISSVVPYLTGIVRKTVESVCKVSCLVINNSIKTGLDNSTLPDELGSDILCNLIAAHHYYPDSHVTVADFGTAFTTETVSPEGKLLGVTIAPGMMTSVKALFEKTAQIPVIRLDLPETVMGFNTVDSIRAGVVFGFIGQIKEILYRIEKEIKTKPLLVVTGGFSRYVGPYLDCNHRADIYFTLDGARIAWNMNR